MQFTRLSNIIILEKYFLLSKNVFQGNKQFNFFGMKMLFHILILVDILMRHCHSYGNEKKSG